MALAVLASLTGSAFAADLPAAPMYSKAPIIPPPPSWTGFYIFGGVGGGIWDADNSSVVTSTGQVLTVNQRLGGDGWLGTAGAGYDWQFSRSWVAGVFGDAMFGSIRGSMTDPISEFTGPEKLRDTWAAGVRVGYLVAPNVLSYVNGGWTSSQWSSSILSEFSAGPTQFSTPSFNRNGWFLGGGVEYNLDIFGISAPGLFVKTEYRASYLNSITLPETLVGGGPVGLSATFSNPLVQTVTTSLVYRFNWSGAPLSARY
jgi:outer membrane immunogenic protein